MPADRAIVADTGPLLGLSRIGRLRLLLDSCSEVLVAPAVVEECCRYRRLPGAVTIEKAVERGDLRCHDLEDIEPVPAAPNLGPGEVESISLAASLGLPLLIDDRLARRFAHSLGLEVVGTGAILVRALEQQRIDRLRPVLEELKAVGYRLGPKLAGELLRRAGER